MNVQDNISRLGLDVTQLASSNRCVVVMTEQTGLIQEALNVKVQCASVDLLHSDHVGARGEEKLPIEGVCIPERL